MGSKITNNEINLNKIKCFLLKPITLTKFNKYSKKIYKFYNEHEKFIQVPFYFGISYFKSELYSKLENCNKNTEEELSFVFKKDLRENQLKCAITLLNNLKSYKTSILSCYTGFGKTVIALYIISKLNLPVLIIVPRVQLIDQWYEEISNFLNVKAVKLISKNNYEFSGNCTIGIVNSINLHKIKNVNFFKFIILDEVHLQMTELMCQKLIVLEPKFLLGISATPYRTDDFNCLFDLFFSASRIEEILKHKHEVFRVNTGFKPDLIINKNGLDWNNLLDQQSLNIERNNLIVKIANEYKNKYILILVRRINQAEYLYNALVAKDEKVSRFYGKHYESTSGRIIIGTTSKIGTGFNCVKLNMLIIGGDMISYYLQFLGRVMRIKNNNPLVFDLVDDNSKLISHFFERCKIYNLHGGIIKNYN